MHDHPLDRPAWNALSTRQAKFAMRSERAARFDPEIGPLAGICDDDPTSVAELATLASAVGPLVLVQATPVAAPAGTLATPVEGVQLVLGRLTRAAAELGDRGVEPLCEADFPAMYALATLTKPGPFAARTPRLGEFWGVKERGVLVAMAGERMKLEGFTEVSGVCTHPSARGRGLARMLSAWVTRRILARGETPFLHAYANNAVAIQLYESLGFRLRSRMHLASLRTSDATLS